MYMAIQYEIAKKRLFSRFCFGANTWSAGENFLTFMFNFLKVWFKRSPTSDIIVTTQELAVISHHLAFAANCTFSSHDVVLM